MRYSLNKAKKIAVQMFIMLKYIQMLWIFESWPPTHPQKKEIEFFFSCGDENFQPSKIKKSIEGSDGSLLKFSLVFITLIYKSSQNKF